MISNGDMIGRSFKEFLFFFDLEDLNRVTNVIFLKGLFIYEHQENLKLILKIEEQEK